MTHRQESSDSVRFPLVSDRIAWRTAQSPFECPAASSSQIIQSIGPKATVRDTTSNPQCGLLIWAGRDNFTFGKETMLMQNNSTRNSTVLVVGATGVLGMEVCRQLAAAGKKVKGLLRISSQKEKVNG